MTNSPELTNEELIRENERLRAACQSVTTILTSRAWRGSERESVMASLNVLDVALGGPGKWR